MSCSGLPKTLSHKPFSSQSRRPDRQGGPEIRRCPLDRGAPTNRRSQAPHFGNRPEQRSCTSSLVSIPLSQRLSDCEDDPAKGAALNEVTQSICRLRQRERLCHDGLDPTRLK